MQVSGHGIGTGYVATEHTAWFTLLPSQDDQHNLLQTVDLLQLASDITLTTGVHKYCLTEIRKK